MTPFADWQNFYVIVGSSAGALIGLQFVVMALVTNRPNAPGPSEGGEAFATPTIVHFGTVLLLAGVLSAPWRGTASPAFLWGLVGAFGVIYAAINTRRMMTQSVYKPEFEDWLFHAVLPILAYTVLAASACEEFFHPRGALFSVAAATMLLLMIGVHNAWDSVTYHVFTKRPQSSDTEDR